MELKLKKSAVILIVIMFVAFHSFSQSDSIKRRIKSSEIKNQGDNEKYWAQEVFDKKYKPQVFERYKGKIVTLSKNSYDYDGNIFLTNFIDPSFKKSGRIVDLVAFSLVSSMIYM